MEAHYSTSMFLRVTSSLWFGAVTLGLTSLVPPSTLAQSQTAFHFTEKPGPFGVGLRVVEQYDSSRVYRHLTGDLGKPFQGERARPLQTLIWYPAEKTDGAAMTVGDYAALMATETSFGHSRMTEDAKELAANLAPVGGTRMWAVREASLRKGRYPVVVYAPSFNAESWENADLCEYLASHGYVVLSSPELGATTHYMTSDVAGVNEQAQDVSFLIGYAQTLPDTDMSAVAAAGFSWGGLSTLFAAARDNRIDALVALDGSSRYFPGLVKQAVDVHPDQMAIPLLFFTQGEITIEDQEQPDGPEKSKKIGPSVLNAWTHGDLVTVHMLGLVHTEFSAMDQRNEETWVGFEKDEKADYGRDYGSVGYGLVARYTLNFLNAYLRHDAAGVAFLRRPPVENGAPPHFMTVSYRPATGVPASFESFRSAVGEQGFGQAAAVYRAMQKIDSAFKLDDIAVHAWAMDLIADGHISEAIALLAFDVQVSPDPADANELLGDAYAEAGQKQAAIESYKKALAINPADDDAKHKLDRLAGTITGAKP